MNFKRFHESKNLFDADTIYGIYKQSDGAFQAEIRQFYVIKATPFTTDDIGKTFTFATNISPVSGNVRVCANIGETVVSGDSATRSSITFTVESANDTLYLNYGSGGGIITTLSEIMLNEGSTPQPYEPYSSEVWHDIPHYIHNTATDTITTLPADIYANDTTATVGLKGNTVQNGTPTPDNPIMPQGTGDLETVGAKAGQYKIPISSANTTTPVYLGEVQTTRKVKKLVLTGDEGWARAVNQKCYYINSSKGCPADYLKSKIITVICSHYAGQENTNSGSNEVNEGCVCFFIGGGYELYIGESTITSATDFKAYLAQQYAAGTPVTIWYVLATEETGIVNEPLMKIGNYADTVSGITIPTITGKDSFDVLTTLKPSEVSLTYTGWHDATVKEWDGSQWNE